MARKLENNEMENDISGKSWPIKLKAPIPATLGELKEKISKEYDIPKDTQNWIVGKKLVNDNDKIAMEKLNNSGDDDSIYLFLSAPIIQIDDTDDDDDGNNEANKSIEANIEEDHPMIHDTDDSNVEYYDVDSSSDNASDDVEIVEISDKNENEILPNNNPIPNHQETTIQTMELNQDNGLKIITEELEGPKGYDELMMLEGCDTVPNVDDITCPICLEVFGPAEAVVLQDCLHTFCWVCLQNTIKHCESPVVRCPFVDDDSACESNLREREIKALVSPEIYEKHLSKSVTLAESRAGKSAFHCQTPNCTNWCFIEEEDEIFPCSVCNKTNCLKCRVMHDGMNCYQYQEELRKSKEQNGESEKTEAMIKEMLAKRQVMTCPTCSVLLTKISGCDSITCGICKTLLCWPTRGPRWGPRGPGDTSGGCRCKLNRKRCHPECGGCH